LDGLIGDLFKYVPGQGILVREMFVKGHLADTCLFADFFHRDASYAVAPEKGPACINDLVELDVPFTCHNILDDFRFIKCSSYNLRYEVWLCQVFDPKKSKKSINFDPLGARQAGLLNEHQKPAVSLSNDPIKKGKDSICTFYIMIVLQALVAT
jgi:hypothetical protein